MPTNIMPKVATPNQRNFQLLRVAIQTLAFVSFVVCLFILFRICDSLDNKMYERYKSEKQSQYTPYIYSYFSSGPECECFI